MSVRDLDVMFRRGGRDLHAVRGVSFDVMPGEIVGVVGESGSGKSVLGLSLLGFAAPRPCPPGQRECARLRRRHGVGVRRGAPARAQGRISGAVFQDPMTSLNPTMRIGKQVVEAAGTKAEALRLLDAVGIPEAGRRFTQYPHELSGGLRQRVMIALAIAGNPQLVIADEPTTALDVTVQAQILALLRELADDLNCAFMFVTHDLGVASQLADHVAVMYGGRMAEFGDSAVGAAPTRAPVHRGPARVAPHAARPIANINSRRCRANRPTRARIPPGCAFAPRCALRVEDAASTAHRRCGPAGTHDGIAACIRIGELQRLDDDRRRRPTGRAQ